jgi:hypothetical protein
MSDSDSDLSQIIDQSVKRLFRDQPQALLRLAGISQAAVRYEDANLNVPQLSADHVFIIEEPGQPGPCALYIEYQLKPEPHKLALWALKWAGLCRQLGMPVVLLVIYLERGKRATFPSVFRQQSGGGLRTTLTFETIRLWEHRDRIVSGEWPELAPLLVLCEARPTMQTLRQEVELIHRSGLPRTVQAELLGLAIAVASRRFRLEMLRGIFREELGMMDAEQNLMEFVLDAGLAEKWLRNPRFQEEIGRGESAEQNLMEFVLDAGLAEKWLRNPRFSGEMRTEAKAEGKEEGETEATRRLTLSFLTRRFGDLPQSLMERIKTSDVVWCQKLFDRAIGAETLTDLLENL